MITKKKGKIVATPSTRASVLASRKYVKAAEGDDEFDDVDEFDEDSDGLMDAIDDVADNVEDIQDQMDEIEEDQVDIAINNNIADHFIAECERCNGVFISAVVDSDQNIDHVNGTCPLCGRETDQYLKWVIRDATE